MKSFLRKWYWRFFNLFCGYRKTPLITRSIDVDSKDVAYICDSSDVVIHVNNGKENFFFKECKFHDLSQRKYIDKCMNEFFEFVYSGNNAEKLRRFIDQTLECNGAWKKFINMGALYTHSSNVARYCHGYSDSNCLGFDFKGNPELEKEFKVFIRYIWSQIENYDLNYFCAIFGGGYNVSNACKALASKNIANSLGIGYLIPETNFVELKINGIRKIGIAVDSCAGESPEKKKYQNLTDNFVKQIIELQLLDLICYQLDHRPGNYFVIQNSKGDADMVEAFDNDANKTFFISSNIEYVDNIGCNSIVRDGEIVEYYIPQEIVKNIIKYSPSILNCNEQYLSIMQFIFMRLRLRKLKKALKVFHNKTDVVNLSVDTLRTDKNTYIEYFIKNHINDSD